jgi:hypothetical protein
MYRTDGAYRVSEITPTTTTSNKVMKQQKKASG